MLRRPHVIFPLMAALTARAAAGSTSTGACFSFAASTLPASTRWRGTTSSCAAAALSSRAFRTERGQFSAPLFSPHRLPAAPATGGLARFAMSSAQGARPDGNGVSRMIVVGGGPAGFMCAVEAARAARAAGTPLEVIILEATSKVLGKVKISGGGRCNVLHDETKGAKLISEGYPRGDKPLLSAFSRFGPVQTADWFRAEGVVLKTEGDGRMFPVTDSSDTIIEALCRAADGVGVKVRTGQRVDSVSKSEGRFHLSTSNREKDKGAYECDFLMLSPGSSRLAFQWAATLGHKVEPGVPSLFTFTCSDPVLQGLAGVSVQDAEVSLPFKVRGRKKTLRERGPVLVTHSGVSGPAVLRLSAFGAREMHEVKYSAKMTVNWLPDIDRGEAGATEQLESMKKVFAAKQIGGSSGPTLGLPRRIFQALVESTGIELDAKWVNVRAADIRKLAARLVRSELDISGKGAFKEEFVTAGGVKLEGVEMKTMESKEVPGLFFAGEVLDVDGITGGYNLQAAWTTGWNAGRAIAAAAAHLEASHTAASSS